MRKLVTTTAAIVCLTLTAALAAAEPPPGPGWVPLFNGKDLSGWKLADKAEGHWKAVDGVLDYDAQDGTLWTEKSFGDFVLHIEWRLKTPKDLYGSDKEADGKPYAYTPDSGIFLRGFPKAQTNIWLSPMGSGEVWGYRTDAKLPEEVRKAATPKLRADKPWGEWNAQEITMKGERLTVVLNGQTVIDNAPLPGIPATGPIGLQQHGGYDQSTNRWRPGSACIQFRNIYIKPMADGK
jgi:hypothetical protein